MSMKNWLIEGINQWEQLFGKWNWYTWTLVQVEFEKENMAYGYEFLFILFGLGFRIRYNTEKSHKQFAEWMEDIKETRPIADLFRELSEENTEIHDNQPEKRKLSTKRTDIYDNESIWWYAFYFLASLWFVMFLIGIIKSLTELI